jgi:hypothetical protein
MFFVLSTWPHILDELEINCYFLLVPSFAMHLQMNVLKTSAVFIFHLIGF